MLDAREILYSGKIVWCKCLPSPQAIQRALLQNNDRSASCGSKKTIVIKKKK
jgi:hypothetical protein